MSRIFLDWVHGFASPQFKKMYYLTPNVLDYDSWPISLWILLQERILSALSDAGAFESCGLVREKVREDNIRLIFPLLCRNFSSLRSSTGSLALPLKPLLISVWGNISGWLGLLWVESSTSKRGSFFNPLLSSFSCRERGTSDHKFQLTH